MRACQRLSGPDESKPATESTELRIAYDDEAPPPSGPGTSASR